MALDKHLNEVVNQLHDSVGKSLPAGGSASAKALIAMLGIVQRQRRRSRATSEEAISVTQTENTGVDQAGTGGGREKELDFRYILKIR